MALNLKVPALIITNNLLLAEQALYRGYLVRVDYTVSLVMIMIMIKIIYLSMKT